MTKRDPEQQADELSRLTVSVARLFKGEPQCVAAAALVVEAGRRLGYQLAPRPVSIYAATSDGRAAVSTGEAGRQFGLYLASAYESVDEGLWRTEFDRAGHMIVTSDEGGWILDPTFPQFARYGLPYEAIVAQGNVHPDDGVITKSEPDFGVKYWLDDSNDGWEVNYQRYLDQNLPLAAKIAKLVRDGHPKD